MKIGYVQFAPTFGDIEANMAKIESLLADNRDADLLVLPELASTGYRFDSRDEALALSQPGEYTIRLEGAAVGAGAGDRTAAEG